MEKLKPKNHKLVIHRDVQLSGVTSKIGHPYFSLILFTPSGLLSDFLFSGAIRLLNSFFIPLR